MRVNLYHPSSHSCYPCTHPRTPTYTTHTPTLQHTHTSLTHTPLTSHSHHTHTLISHSLTHHSYTHITHHTPLKLHVYRETLGPIPTARPSWTQIRVNCPPSVHRRHLLQFAVWYQVILTFLYAQISLVINHNVASQIDLNKFNIIKNLNTITANPQTIFAPAFRSWRSKHNLLIWLHCIIFGIG